jgi:hypothetical protein
VRALDFIDANPDRRIPARGSESAEYAVTIRNFLYAQACNDPDWLRHFRPRHFEHKKSTRLKQVLSWLRRLFVFHWN